MRSVRKLKLLSLAEVVKCICAPVDLYIFLCILHFCACVLVYLFHCVCPKNQLSPTSTLLNLVSYILFIFVYLCSCIFEYLCTFISVLILFVSQVTSENQLAPT